jgi:uncharacterized protein
MPLEQLLADRRDEIVQVASRHGVRRVRVFGSAARGEAKPDSDLDLLVDAGPNTSPWSPAGLVQDLESLLGCRVDFVTEAGLLPEVRAAVLQDARQL